MTVLEAIKNAYHRVGDCEGRTSREAFWLLVPASFTYPFVAFGLLYFIGVMDKMSLQLFLGCQIALFSPITRRLIDAGIGFWNAFSAFVLAVVSLMIVWKGSLFETVYFQTDCIDCGDGELAVSPVMTDLFEIRTIPASLAFTVIGILAATYFVALLMQPSAHSNDTFKPSEAEPVIPEAIT